MLELLGQCLIKVGVLTAWAVPDQSGLGMAKCGWHDQSVGGMAKFVWHDQGVVGMTKVWVA
eukprot:8457737-Alexandrium_andersonii.AAC.1